MKLKIYSCPNCGANYNPAKYHCEYCGSYIFMSNDRFTDVSNIKIETPEKINDETIKYPGVYVFGRLLGKGERPISLGVANYYTGTVAAGGKLLLTNKSLSFSAHAFNIGRQEAKIDLIKITDVEVVANFIISQHILVTENGRLHKFVVYHGNEWVQKIKEAINKCEEFEEPIPMQKTMNYIEELKQLKHLLDVGVITEEEFNIKKEFC